MLLFSLPEQFVLRVHEGPVETPQLWREITINKKTTVHDVIVSIKNAADWLDIFFINFVFIILKKHFFDQLNEGANQIKIKWSLSILQACKGQEHLLDIEKIGDRKS